MEFLAKIRSLNSRKLGLDIEKPERLSEEDDSEDEWGEDEEDEDEDDY